MSVPSISKEQWNQLSDKAKWDIKVALRGPDSYYGETLKWFTTSVIRAKVRDAFRVGGTVNKYLNLVILPWGNDAAVYEEFSKAGQLAWNYQHFVEHVSVAASWLGIPILQVEDAVWHAAMRERYSKAAGTVIIAAADAYSRKPESGRPRLYKPSYIKELSRHLSSDALYT